MTVCKYMSAHWGLDYLSKWHLKITPPAEFNDPFELRPLASNVFREEDTASSLRKLDVEAITNDVAKSLEPLFAGKLSPYQVRDFVRSLMPGAPLKSKARARKMLGKAMPEFTVMHYKEAERNMQARWPEVLGEVEAQVNAALPTINTMMRQKITEEFPSTLGVLCLSRQRNHPLMWSHYAESHRGMVLEFDDTHPSLRKRRTETDEFGFLRPVVYSETRPELNMDAVSKDIAFQVIALTKSSHWAYEDELRMVWPLKFADKSMETPVGQVALISIPAEALLSVTLGCKTSPQQEEQVLKVLSGQERCSHVLVQKARMHETEFALVYEQIAQLGSPDAIGR